LDYINQIILGHALNVLPKLPAESVNCVICSPPYWGLRDYGIEPVIWDGDKNCKHEWGNKIVIKSYGNVGTHPNVGSQKIDAMKGSENKGQFCQICGAWRGSLGLEPTFELYIKHLCDIFDEVKRVLRKDGTCFVNMGDTYYGGGGGHQYSPSNKGFLSKAFRNNPEYEKAGGFTYSYRRNKETSNKSLCLIPQRFVIEMVNRGWIAHNELIWHKPNCMPSSAKKRFTVDFEPVFFFSKSNKTLFWTNEKTLECVDKKPLGTNGIEDKDWEWRPCPNCHGEGTIIGKALKKGAAPIVIGPGIVAKNTKAFKICPRCKGLKKVKYSFWTGHDYWFDQQFEEYDKPLNRWGGDIQKSRTEKKTIYEKDMKLGRTSKLVEGAVRPNPQGRNKRCVWIIPTQPFPEAHFAVYPEGLIEIPIKAGCPEFVCKKCGKARVKIYENHRRETRPGNYSKYTDDCYVNSKRPEGLKKRIINNPVEIGYSNCGCNVGFESGIVLDPFIGTGTTAKVAIKQRKRFIGIDIKKEYIEMSKRGIAKVQRNLF